MTALQLHQYNIIVEIDGLPQTSSNKQNNHLYTQFVRTTSFHPMQSPSWLVHIQIILWVLQVSFFFHSNTAIHLMTCFLFYVTLACVTLSPARYYCHNQINPHKTWVHITSKYCHGFMNIRTYRCIKTRDQRSKFASRWSLAALHDILDTQALSKQSKLQRA